ncbi:hypothetical protein EV1_044806 [Malus domestica]
MVTDRTNEMRTPSPRCLPEHYKHMKTPYEIEAHYEFFWEQSTQVGDCRSQSRRDAAIFFSKSDPGLICLDGL